MSVCLADGGTLRCSRATATMRESKCQPRGPVGEYSDSRCAGCDGPRVRWRVSREITVVARANYVRWTARNSKRGLRRVESDESTGRRVPHGASIKALSDRAERRFLCRGDVQERVTKEVRSVRLFWSGL